MPNRDISASGTIKEDLLFENLITIKEFCRITKFSPRTVYNWKHRGRGFPYIKWGKSIRLELQKVILWLKNRE